MRQIFHACQTASVAVVAVLAASCGSTSTSLEDTVPFRNVRHAILEGRVVGISGQPIDSALVTVRFVSGLDALTFPLTNSDGRFSVFAEAGTPSSTNPDTITGYTRAAVYPPRNPIRVTDSVAAVVRFGPIELPPPVTRVEVRLPIP